MFVKIEDRPIPSRENDSETLKLSEALRESIKRFPVQGLTWDSTSPCALCGVAYTVGYDRTKDGRPWEFLVKRWPVLNTPYGSHDLRCEIEYRNVMRRHTNGENRPAIADWLESQGY